MCVVCVCVCVWVCVCVLNLKVLVSADVLKHEIGKCWLPWNFMCMVQFPFVLGELGKRILLGDLAGVFLGVNYQSQQLVLFSPQPITCGVTWMMATQ